MEQSLIVGVDGGGTHSRLAAVRPDGTVLALADGGGVNFNAIGMDEARRRLHQALIELLDRCGAAGYDALAVGMSALDDRPDQSLVRQFAGQLLDVDKLTMHSDVYMALMGATLGGPGAMVISGTGAMAIALDEAGRVHTRGGWGYLLDDPGSAYAVAVQALRAALAAWEGVGEATQLCDRALQFFGMPDERALIVSIYQLPVEPARIAQFARAVLAAAAEGDPVAARLVDQNMAYLAGQAAQLIALCPPGAHVYLYGGMFEHNEWVTRLFSEKLAALRPGARALRPEFPPEIGAVISHLKQVGGLTDAVVANLRRTWKEVAG